MGFYWAMHKYNLFNVNTASLVNVRDQTDFGARNSLARVSAGAVEGKLLEKQVEAAADAVQKVAGATGNADLRRASQDLNTVRNSVRVARQSLGAAQPQKDAETGVGTSAGASLARMQQTVQQIEKALASAPAAERELIQVQLDAVRQTAERLAAIDRQMRAEQK